MTRHRPAARPAGRRGVRVAALAVAGLLLAGCGGLSRAGPVEGGLQVGSGETSPLTVVYPGPQPGAGQESIVRGFIRAGAASDGAYDNARRFLTAAASEQWNPDATLVVRASDDAPTVRQVDQARVAVTTATAGTIDASGRFTAAEPGATVTATFSLASVGGQWRIATIPQGFGRWIASSDVARLVQPFAVHYVSTSRRATVPDVRWFPLDRLAPRLARAQLDPVPAFLEGAAVSAVPNGARLLGDAVSVDDGVASVNLISDSLAPGQATRENLWAQFLTTLTQEPSVASVLLSVDGVPVDVDGVDGPVSSVTRVGFPEPAPAPATAKPVVRRGATVSVFDPGARAQEQGRQTPSPSQYPSVPEGYTHLALSADGAELAAVDPDGDGVSRWRGGNRYEVPGVGGRVGAPAYDRRGFLWVAGVGDDAERLFCVDLEADPADPQAAAATPVAAQWLAGRRVVQARVAADGDRIAVLSTQMDGHGPRVDLAGVVRADGDRPQRLSAPLRLGVEFSSARGLAWLDDQSLATVAGIGGGPLRPTVLTVGGELRILPEVPEAVAVATTGGERNLHVVTSQGRLVVRAGPRWVDSGPAQDLAPAAG